MLRLFFSLRMTNFLLFFLLVDVVGQNCATAYFR